MMPSRLLAFAAVALAARAAAADCAMTSLETTVITKPGAKISSDAGILAAATVARGDTREATPGKHPEWRMRAGKDKLVPKITEIAPGLYVYRLPGTTQAGTLELENAKGKLVGSAAATIGALRLPPTPNVTKVEYAREGSRHFSEKVTATLDAEPPPGAFALALADGSGKVLSWAPVTPGSKVQNAFVHSDCEVMPDGSSAARPGDTVTVFWVTDEGRTSSRSQKIKVSGTDPARTR